MVEIKSSLHIPVRAKYKRIGFHPLANHIFNVFQTIDYMCTYLYMRVSFSDINECSSNPCQNGGTCTDGVDRFECLCVPEHTGYTCETSSF